MKIRFGTNDVVDTKQIDGGGADISELEGKVEAIENAPIYTAEFTEQEINYIVGFVELCTNMIERDELHIGADGIKFGENPLTNGWSGITFTTVSGSTE